MRHTASASSANRPTAFLSDTKYTSHLCKKFKEFKENEDHSYSYYSKLFNVSDSALKRIVGGKTELSYSMYLKFKKLGVFEELKKKKPINYEDVPIKFKVWKDKMGYTNTQC